jgi:hypothetical protein
MKAPRSTPQFALSLRIRQAGKLDHLKIFEPRNVSQMVRGIVISRKCAGDSQGLLAAGTITMLVNVDAADHRPIAPA